MRYGRDSFRTSSMGNPARCGLGRQPIEVTLQVAVTVAGKGRAGVQFWLIGAGR